MKVGQSDELRRTASGKLSCGISRLDIQEARWVNDDICLEVRRREDYRQMRHLNKYWDIPDLYSENIVKITNTGGDYKHKYDSSFSNPSSAAHIQFYFKNSHLASPSFPLKESVCSLSISSFI